ncbi:undecaprenyl-diphosphatase [Capsulimonas corticalis]|uniref:Undecaprenyl-diphosphatase n=1 Tax=Capsulimonas corticalis TaxID=2219043 RepID=A0A402D6Z9_9BACT|nr:undecaprenyl-diphosphatase UppP [Capsulimonas corticalis]BDI29359.1 undecaprenyl-diphosphatase [Capsulimonas corticalis]
MPPPPTVPDVSVLHALILGIVQGATEFLPVSSTAHMRILPALLHWEDPGAAFSAVVQLGPIAAIIAYFRHDLAKYIAGVFRSLKAGKLFPEDDTDARLGWYTILGTIPLAVAGLLLEKHVDTTFRSLNIIGVCLIVLALVLLVAERISKRNTPLERLAFGPAMAVGFAQVLALVPGASRSGCTITTGLLVGLDRESAARFSFLLSIPAITLAGLYKLYKVVHHTHLGHAAVPYLLGAIVAGVVAYVVVRWLLGYLGEENHTTTPFILYRIMLGIAILVLVQIGYVDANAGAKPLEPAAQGASARLDIPMPTHLASR